MDSIDWLEKRIAALELAVLPQTKDVPIDKSQIITELLLQTHSMTLTALSCREVITTVLKQVEMVNDYLNPNYSDIQLDLEDKRRYVLELYPEMQKTMQLVVDFDRIKALLESPVVNNIPSLVEQLQKLTLSNISTYEECKEVNSTVLRLLQQYANITKSFKILFAQLEQSVTIVEEAMKPKQPVDE